MTPDLLAIASNQINVFTIDQARRCGLSADEIQTARRSGRWIGLRRGIYTTAEPAVTDEHRHLQLAMAAVLAVNREAVASHWTAAVAHGLPLIRPLPERPQIVANREHSRTLSGVRVFAGALHAGHVADLSMPPRTTVARTISDIARTRAVDDALVMLEHALRERICTTADVEQVIADCPTWRGIVWTKRILEWAQPLNESPGETLSFLRMRQRGLPLPRCQVAVEVRGRRYRLDFLWDAERTIGEFDGRSKYRTADDVYAEKRREDDLRSLGFGFVRWGWSDVRGDGASMEAKARAAFALQRAAA